MKFIASSSSLLKQLQIVNSVISSKVVIPILEYFLFEVDNNSLRIVGTDLEVSIQAIMSVESKENGKIAVPSKIILETLKNLPDQPITFTINEETHFIELSYDNGKAKISGEVAEDFPKFPVLENASNFAIPEHVLDRAVSKTLFAIGSDELKPALTGLFLEMNTENVRFVSTDGNKLVKYQRNDVRAETPTSFILPKKALNVIKNSLTAGTSDVEVKFNKVNTQFQINDITIVCRLIDEKFPDYNSAMPVDLPNKLRINRNELVNSLKRIAIFSNKTTYQVKFTLSGNELQLNAQDLDYSNEANERLACEYEGENMEIGFSARFLGEMLGSMDSEEVILSLSAHNRPGTLTPAVNADSEELIMLLMPIVIKFS